MVSIFDTQLENVVFFICSAVVIVVAIAAQTYTKVHQQAVNAELDRITEDANATVTINSASTRLTYELYKDKVHGPEGVKTQSGDNEGPGA